MHRGTSDIHRAPFFSGRRTACVRCPPVHALTLAIGLSLMAVGLLGALASQVETQRQTTPLAEALRAPPGSRVLVRGLLEGVRAVAGGAALSTLSDCAGGAAAVFFGRGAPENLSWRLVTLDATVEVYKGVSELAVAAPEDAVVFGEAASVVEPDALAEAWRALLCRTVAVHAPVLWGEPSADDPLAVDIGIATTDGDLKVLAHSDVFLEVAIEAGASATFIGVVAASKDGTQPVLHVRV